MDILTIFNKKYEKGNIVYLVCSKRGTNSDKWRGKAKYYKKTGEIIIYNKCTNDPIIHNTIDINKFEQLYHDDNFNNIYMKLRLLQRYYTICLFKDNKAQNFIDIVSQFKNKFTNIKFILNEETVRKMEMILCLEQEIIL